jgi:hypothetical protein
VGEIGIGGPLLAQRDYIRRSGLSSESGCAACGAKKLSFEHEHRLRDFFSCDIRVWYEDWEFRDEIPAVFTERSEVFF